MKILLVFDSNTDSINGVSQSVANLYRGLDAAGYDVRVLMPEGNGPERGFFSKSHDFSFAYPGFRMSVFLSRAVRRDIYAWGPDIVHSNSEGILFWWSRLICRKTGARHIHTFHTNFIEFYNDYFPLVKSLSRKIMTGYAKLCSKRLSAAVSPSEWGREVFRSLGLNVPHYVVSNGIDVRKFGDLSPAERAGIRSEVRRRYGINDSEILLVFVGRVAPEKNLPELLKLFAGLPCGNCTLMIVGGGPEEDSLQRRAAELSIEGRVVFTGMVPPDDVHKYYNAADIFVTASLSEIQPLTYVEAMASSLPVVCSYAAYTDGLIINGKTGYAFTSPEEFVQYVSLLSGDLPLRQTIGKEARKHVEQEYSIETFAGRCMKIYERADNN